MKKQEGSNARNSRSQRGLQQRQELRDNLSQVQNRLRYLGNQISEGEESKAWLLKHSVGSHAEPHHASSYFLGLQKQIVELSALRGTFAVVEEQRVFLQAEIEKLDPKPSDVKARGENQSRLAKLTADRLEKDREADAALQVLRGLLQQRGQMTAKMMECASTIEFTVDGEKGLDARRFDELLASLPEEFSGTSERWADWFLGQQKSVKTYIVRDERLVLPETLENHGVYRFGEEIQLTENEARELLREDRSEPRAERPGRCIPPSIITVEAYEQAVSDAEAKGVDVDDILFWQNSERGWVISPSSRFSVKLKAKRQVQLGGKTYQSGDDFEVAYQHASQLIESGAVERPF
jgi:hypothetical protein